MSADQKGARGSAVESSTRAAGAARLQQYADAASEALCNACQRGASCAVCLVVLLARCALVGAQAVVCAACSSKCSVLSWLLFARSCEFAAELLAASLSLC